MNGSSAAPRKGYQEAALEHRFDRDNGCEQDGEDRRVLVVGLRKKEEAKRLGVQIMSHFPVEVTLVKTSFEPKPNFGYYAILWLTDAEDKWELHEKTMDFEDEVGHIYTVEFKDPSA